MNNEPNQTDTPQEEVATIKVILTREFGGFGVEIGGGLSGRVSNLTILVAEMLKRSITASATATLENLSDLFKQADAYFEAEAKGGDQ